MDDREAKKLTPSEDFHDYKRVSCSSRRNSRKRKKTMQRETRLRIKRLTEEQVRDNER